MKVTKEILINYISDCLKGYITIDKFVDLINSEPLTSEEILSELREVNPYPLHITIGKRCPICDGRGFVHSDFYNQVNLSQGSSKTNLTTICRTCNGRGII